MVKVIFVLFIFLNLNNGNHHCHFTANENSESSKSYVNFLYLKFLTCYFQMKLSLQNLKLLCLAKMCFSERKKII